MHRPPRPHFAVITSYLRSGAEPFGVRLAPTTEEHAMTWTISLIAAAIALSLIQSCAPGGAAAAGVSGRELVAKGATLLDVRTPEEFASGHPDGAVLIPVSELAARIGELPRDRPVVVYCRSGRRSAAAAEQLRTAGFEVHDVGALADY
jgi:phage shock protein E